MLLTIGRSGASLSVATRKTSWTFSHIGDYPLFSEVPGIFPEVSAAIAAEAGGSVDLCLGISYSEPPSVVSVSPKLRDLEESQILHCSPEKVVDGWDRGGNVRLSLVRNPRHPHALAVGVPTQVVTELLTQADRSGYRLLRVQSTLANLLSWAVSTDEVRAGRAHFAAVDHGSVTIVETGPDGEFTRVHFEMDGATQLPEILERIAADAPPKPVLLLSATESDLTGFVPPEGAFKIAFQSATDRPSHLGALCLLAK